MLALGQDGIYSFSFSRRDPEGVGKISTANISRYTSKRSGLMQKGEEKKDMKKLYPWKTLFYDLDATGLKMSKSW